jgi:hypothetical protein
VNSNAAVPTTRTSITMPFRKNFGFKREPPVESGHDRASSACGEYSVGAGTGPLTDVPRHASLRTDYAAGWRRTPR